MATKTDARALESGVGPRAATNGPRIARDFGKCLIVDAVRLRHMSRWQSDARGSPFNFQLRVTRSASAGADGIVSKCHDAPITFGTSVGTGTRWPMH
jgi:hypothetical protein